MRNVLILGPLCLTACAAMPAPTPVHGTVPGRVCIADGTDGFIGQPGNVETGTQIIRATNSAVLRWAPPGYMITMDFSASRVTVKLDQAYRITGIHCG